MTVRERLTPHDKVAAIDPDRPVNTTKAARWFGCHPRTIINRCRDGKSFPHAWHFQNYSSWLVPVKDLIARRALPVDLTLLDELQDDDREESPHR